MNIDYLIASLPSLRFGEPPPLSQAKFEQTVGASVDETVRKYGATWADIETQLRNAQAEARGGTKYLRDVKGCAIYWKNRILDAFKENDVARRDELIDRAWWDAAGELTPANSPLGAGALATYAVRLKLALKRARISKSAGGELFGKLTDITILNNNP